MSTNNFRRVLVVAFNDAIKWGYTRGNEAEKVEQVKVVETEEGVLTPKETLALLSEAEELILPAIVIGAFAGLRSSELEHLDWADVNLDEGHIRVRTNSAKNSRNRLITISANLKAWLSPHARKSDPIWPTNGRKILEGTRHRAGFGNSSVFSNRKTIKMTKPILFPDPSVANFNKTQPYFCPPPAP